MSTTETTPAVRAFEIGFDESEIAAMRKRIAATRWPERETVDDDSQGVPLATMQELARYWSTGFDWHDRGGHFAAWEQPQLFSEELRTAFRSLRT